MSDYAFGSIDELGEGPGFRKVRQALGVEAFGVNAVVYPPHFEGFPHYHDEQDELYFVHKGRARVDVDGKRTSSARAACSTASRRRCGSSRTSATRSS